MNKFAPHFQRFSAEMRILWLYAKWRWLRPVTQAALVEQRHKLGIQWQRETEQVLEYNRLVLPTILKSINCRTRLFWEMLVGDNPNALCIYRHYPNWDFELDPEQRAKEAVDELSREIGDFEDHGHYLLDIIDAVECNNEFIHSFEHDRFDAADRYMAAFVYEAHRRLALKTVALNSACGHFAEETADCFPLTLAALAETGGYLGMHEYDAWTMDRLHVETVDKDGGYWLCGKWKRAMGPIKEKYGDAVKVVITECGVDGGVLGEHKKGWRDINPNLAIAMESYCGSQSLAWYNDLLNDDDLMVGVAIFIISGEGDWSRFDIADTEIPQRIAQFPGVEVEPPEGNGGEMDIKVYDFDHSPFEAGAPYRDMEYLYSIFGDVRIHDIESQTSLRVGALKLKVVWLDCRVGDTAAMIHVDDEYGKPKEGMVGVMGWPDAEPHGLTAAWNLWTSNGAVGTPTEANGDAGLGSYGPGAYYGPPEERGPHFIWVHSLPSDMVDGLGMLTMHPEVEGNHLHVNVGYQAVIHGEEPQPPPQGDLAEELDTIGQSMIEDGQRVKEIAGLIGDGGGISEAVVKHTGGGETVLIPK